MKKIWYYNAVFFGVFSHQAISSDLLLNPINSCAFVDIRPVQTITSLKDIHICNYAQKKNILFFDIDATLVKHKYCFNCPERADLCKYLDKTSGNALSDLSHACHLRTHAFYYFLISKEHESMLIEDDALATVKKLTKDAYIFCLTARQKEVRESTARMLDGLGFDFRTSSGLGTYTVELDETTLLHDGIIYTGNKKRKAHILSKALAVIAPRLGIKGACTSIHVDDSRSEIDAYDTATWEVSPTLFPTLWPLLFEGVDVRVNRDKTLNMGLFEQSLNDVLPEFRLQQPEAAVDCCPYCALGTQKTM